MTETDAICENCKHWERKGKDECYHPSVDIVQLNDEGCMEVGSCLRFPPSIISRVIEMQSKCEFYKNRNESQLFHGMLLGASLHPLTYDTERCGEFKAAKTKGTK